MPMNDTRQVLEFGPFRVDTEQRLLMRENQPVPLSPKAFDLLLVLLLRRGQVVLKDDLMKTLWPDTFVEESNLGQHVFQLRKALGERPQDHSYIVTIPGRGYRFVQQVRSIETEVRPQEIVVQSHSRSRLVIEENLPHQSLRSVRRTRLALAIAALGILFALIAACFLRPLVPRPSVVRIRQLTHLGTVVYNTKLFTDGPRIYFREWEGQKRVVRYVSPQGGEVFPVEGISSGADIEALSPNGSEFLFLDLGDPRDVKPVDDHQIWRVAVASGSPRPVGDLRAKETRWSPDGSHIAYLLGSELKLANEDGSNPRTLANLPGRPYYLQWSPDGQRIRFSLEDPRGLGLSLWQADLSGRPPRPMLPDWPSSSHPHAGEWTPDGHYYFFTALGEGARDIWALREPQDIWHRTNPRPVRVTAGPLNFYRPTPSRDGKSIFAVGLQTRGQLLRYDMPSRQYVPYAQGISVDHVAFSRDGQWMAYVENPEGALVRCRVDGSDRRQLTFAPMHVFHPQWSPDGKQLAFQGSANQGAPNRIYLISREGGRTELATPERNDQQLYPSWSSSGDSIVFSSAELSGSNPALYRLDLQTKQVSQFPGTAGLYWGQVSPDGRHIVALTDPVQKLALYDTVSHETRLLAGLADYPIWSADGKYVYFSTLFFRGRTQETGLFRWQESTNKIEKIINSPDFLMSGIWGVWFGLTPTGDPLVVRDLSSTDLYALDLDLP